MDQLDSYAGRFANVAFERREGVLQMRLHSGGGPALWGSRETSLHAQLGEAFHAVARDRDNRVVILTGTGHAFIDGFDPQERPDGPLDPVFWDRIYTEGRELISNLLDIPVPVVCAVNGPARVHAELATLGDVVLAAEHASFCDRHYPTGAVPGDGAHVWWTMLLGINRGRSFLLTGEEIDAREARRLGMVAEVLPADALEPRAWALAAGLARQPTAVLRYTRQLLVQPIRRRMLEELGPGLMYEGMAVMDTVWPRPSGG